MSAFTSFLNWARDYREQHSRTELGHVCGVLRTRPPGGYLRRCNICEAPVIYHNKHTTDTISRTEGLQCNNCRNCYKCCECVICKSCHYYGYPHNMCGLCNECHNCCQCVRCSNCGDECADDYCGDCDRCRDCCHCDNDYEDYKIDFFRSDLKFHTCNKIQHKINPTSRFIAAEIEVADIKPSYDDGTIGGIVQRWCGSIVKDGSLPYTGFEINTAPASGDLFVKQIVDICRALEGSGAKVNNQCGLHVHLDARDFNYYDIRRLVQLYAHIESTLFCMVPQSRYKSHYCRPCGAKYKLAISDGRLSYDKVKSNILGTIYTNTAGKDIKLAQAEKYNDARYNALNLHSWFYRGTVECRLFNGTTNVDKIVNWGVMWAMILDYVMLASDEEIASITKDKLPLDTLLTITGKSTRVVEFVKQRYAKYSGVQ